jgi:uncharacterized protein (DUF58 family)
LIYPGARLFLAIAGGGAVAMVVGVLVPGLWLLPLVWSLLLLGAAGLDAALGRRLPMTARLDCPAAVDVGDAFDIVVALSGRPGRRAEAAIGDDPLLRLAGGGRARFGGDGVARLAATAARRGKAHIAGLDLRSLGPLGLVWVVRRLALARDIVVTPGLASLRNDGVALLSRDARAGMMAQLNTGPGGEFEALADYQPGMDRRRIDWKQSARHRALLAKEFRVERDNNIVLAFDCGRTMVEPIAGLPRIDRAITAGLLTAYVSLKMGDRVTLFGFDARVRQLTAPQTGVASFAAIKQAASELDYSGEEANFTLALSTLAQKLNRRSLIILFTDFVDSTSAELMLRAIGRLLGSHLLLCVVMRDDDLENLVAAAPEDADDVARAVIAAGLLRQRRIVLSRLRRMGVEVLEAPWQELGPALAQRYLDTKRRQLL